MISETKTQVKSQKIRFKKFFGIFGIFVVGFAATAGLFFADIPNVSASSATSVAPKINNPACNDPQLNAYETISSDSSQITADQTANINLLFNDQSFQIVNNAYGGTHTLQGTLALQMKITLDGKDISSQVLSNATLPNGYPNIPDYVETHTTFPFKFSDYGVSDTGSHTLQVGWYAASFQPTNTDGSVNSECDPTSYNPPSHISAPQVVKISLVAAPVQNQGGPTNTTNSNNGVSQVTQSTPQTCSTSLTCVLTSVVTILAGIVSELIYTLFFLIVSPILQTVISIYPHEPGFAGVILTGWVVIRNFANILFIIALIAISFGTLFNISKYNYKSLLVRVVIAALLVNFSLAISQGILGVADTLQAQFLPNNAQVIDNLGYKLIVGPHQNLIMNTITTNNGSFSTAVSAIIYLTFSVAAFVVMAAVAAFVVIRIVALWGLLLVSPFAYVGYVLPSTEKWASKWWGTFINYAFFTPILAFGLHLCAVLADAQTTYLGTATQNAFSSSPHPGFAQALANILSTIMIMGCLGMVLSVAKKFGIAGADKVISFANKQIGNATNAPINFARRNLREASVGLLRDKEGNMRTGFRGTLARTAFTLANPDIVAANFQARTKKKNEAAAELVAAANQERIRFAQGGDISSTADLDLLDKRADADINRYIGMDADRLGDEVSRLKADKSPEGKKKLRSLMQASLKNGAFAKMVKKANGGVYAGNASQYMKSVIGDDQAAKNFYRRKLNATALEKGKLELYGLENDDANIEKAQVAKFNSMGPDDYAKLSTDGFQPGSLMNRTMGKTLSTHPEYKMKSSQMTGIVGATGVDLNSGAILFNNRKNAEAFQDWIRDDRDSALAFVNQATRSPDDKPKEVIMAAVANPIPENAPAGTKPTYTEFSIDTKISGPSGFDTKKIVERPIGSSAGNPKGDKGEQNEKKRKGPVGFGGGAPTNP